MIIILRIRVLTKEDVRWRTLQLGDAVELALVKPLETHNEKNARNWCVKIWSIE